MRDEFDDLIKSLRKQRTTVETELTSRRDADCADLVDRLQKLRKRSEETEETWRNQKKS